MAKKSEETTPFRYEGLSGHELMQGMAEAKDVEALANLWQLGDPQISAQLVPIFFGLGDERLARLIVEELLAESLPAPFSPALIQAITQVETYPPLPEQTVTQLLECLSEPDGLGLTYEPIRPQATCWGLAQKIEATEEFALELLARTAPGAENDAVRAAARRLAATAPSVFERAADAFRERLAETSSEEEWREGESLYVAGVGAGRAKAVLGRLGDALLRAAPASCSGAFQVAMSDFVRADGADTALDLLQAEAAGSQPGLNAIAEAGLAPESARSLDFFATVASKQPGLWPLAVSNSAEWSTAEWRRRLQALKTPISDEAQAWLIQNAPPSTLKQLLTVMLAGAVTESDSSALEELGERINQHLAAEPEPDAEGESQPPEEIDLLDATPWGAAKSDEEAPHISAFLVAALMPSDVAELVAQAYAAKKLSAENALALIPDGHESAALRHLEPGDRRRRLAEELIREREEVALEAVGTAQTAAFSVDLAAAAAEHSPEQAFAGGMDGYEGLSQGERDELVGVLEQWGTESELPLLETVMADGHRYATNRRIRAADRAGQLIQPRGDVPEALVSLLGSNKGNLRQAAIRNIEQARPRNDEVIRSLRAIAAGGGVPGDLSAAALDAIAGDLIEDLGPDPDRNKALALLPLLGQTGRSRAFSTLFRFVGEDAVWDDVDVRRAAAHATADAAEGVKDISLDDQTALAELIEGDGREVDPDALGQLNVALSRVLLGGDEALAALYDEFLPGNAPAVDPDVLFGAEKKTIVTHMGLYCKAKAGNERGRQITQLDLVAAALARAAYLHYGQSEPLKAEIRASLKQKDYANLIGAIGNTPDMRNIRGQLETIHDLRSEKGQEAHPGEPATDDDVASARSALKRVATVCVQLLRDANGV
jgi:hypothetical protein